MIMVCGVRATNQLWIEIFEKILELILERLNRKLIFSLFLFDLAEFIVILNSSGK